MRSVALSRLTKRIKLIAIGGTAVGAMVTFAAVAFLYPAVGGSLKVNFTSGWVNAPVVLAVTGLFGVVYTRSRRRHASEALRWLQENRPPDEREHRLTLGLATYHVKLDALGWSLSAIGFGVFNGLVFSWGLGAVVAVTIWFGGEMTCALDYLLYERALRPVTALALAARATGTTAAPGVRLPRAMGW